MPGERVDDRFRNGILHYPPERLLSLCLGIDSPSPGRYTLNPLTCYLTRKNLGPCYAEVLKLETRCKNIINRNINLIIRDSRLIDHEWDSWYSDFDRSLKIILNFETSHFLALSRILMVILGASGKTEKRILLNIYPTAIVFGTPRESWLLSEIKYRGIKQDTNYGDSNDLGSACFVLIFMLITGNGRQITLTKWIITLRSPYNLLFIDLKIISPNLPSPLLHVRSA